MKQLPFREIAAQMREFVPSNHPFNPIWQFIGLAALMASMYVCMCTLCFSNNWLNIAFDCLFFLTPFLAVRGALRLGRRAKVVAAVVLAPILAISLFSLLMEAIFDIPAEVGHRQLSRELGTVEQGGYSVHLAWEETAGGALGAHGVRLEQRRIIVPGLYAFRTLDYFDGASEGSLSAAGPDRIELHIPSRRGHQGVDRVYSLKPWLYF